MDAFGGCAMVNRFCDLIAERYDHSPSTFVVIPLPRPAAKGGTRTKSENTEPDIYT
jgi:hypothetical protein